MPLLQLHRVSLSFIRYLSVLGRELGIVENKNINTGSDFEAHKLCLKPQKNNDEESDELMAT